MYRLRVLSNLSTINLTRSCYINRKLLSRNKHSSKPGETGDIINDGPIKYSKSPASVYKAKTTRTDETESRLWYEPYVLIASISVFLIYFTMLREENDIDQELSTSLYSRIAGLEEHQLKVSLEYNQRNGLDTEAIIKRLTEIEKEKTKSVDF